MPARSITSRRCALAALALIAALCLPPRAAAHGDLHAVIESLTERIAANPEDCALYYSRAELYRLHQDWAEAKADFDRAHAPQPTPVPSVEIYFPFVWNTLKNSSPKCAQIAG